MDNETLRWWTDYWDGRRDGGWPAEETNGDVDRVYRDQARVLSWLLDDRPHGRILELGCGSGALFEELKVDAAFYTGVDVRAPLLETFRQRHRGVSVYAEDASSFVSDEKFDTIVSFGLAQHFNREMLRNHFRNAHRMLADTGVLVVADFSWRSYRMQQLGSALLRIVQARTTAERAMAKIELDVTRHMHAYSRSQIIDMAADAQLSVEIFGSIAVPGYLTARLRKI